MVWKTSIRPVFRKIHLILGIISSFLIFIIALSGSIYALQEEIQDYLFDYRFVKAEGVGLRLSQIEKIAETYLGDSAAVRVHQFSPNRATAVFFNDSQNHGYLFLNQYSGEILHFQNFKNDFFGILLRLHMYLLLPPELGRLIVGYTTIIFLLILISGIFLWIDIKNIKIWRWKRKSRWRRKNFDLHRNLGVLSLPFSALFIFTGLIWAFPSYQQYVFNLLGGQGKTPTLPKMESFTEFENNTLKEDFIFDSLKTSKGDKLNYTVYFTNSPGDPLIISINENLGSFSSLEFFAFDPGNGHPLKVNQRFGPYNKASLADKFLKQNYDIHTGGIGGTLGKIAALLASLSISTLPITGIIILIGKKKKPKNSNKSKS